MNQLKFTYVLLLSAVMLFSCKEQPTKDLGVFNTPNADAGFDLDGIQQGGELIILTLYGPQSYFEFYGEGFGTQYKIADEYAKSIGCTLRVEVLRNENDLFEKLNNGDGDIIAYQVALTDSLSEEYIACGEKELTHFIDSMKPMAWLVRNDMPMLAQSLNEWMGENKDNFLAMTTIKVADDHGHVYTHRRHTYSPILNLAKGQISVHDNLFKKYSVNIGYDWKLLAAQAYQESGFDPSAVSYMGALGLMQLMPRTAQSVGVSIAQAFDPETNLRGAVKYLNKLNQHYASISDRNERLCFVLAAYNGGEGHVDDARQLAKKYGKDPNRWQGNVDQFVLHLSESRYFNDPVVSYGYMRGSETYNYVYSILDRWRTYQRQVR